MADYDFDKKLRLALAWRNKSGSDLAEHIGVTPQAVQKFTSGKGLPNSGKLMDIARFLNVSIDYLLSADDVSGQVEDVLSHTPPRKTDRQAAIAATVVAHQEKGE